MSGICGILYFDKRPIEEREIKQFTNSILHKGNDATGIWHKNHIAFGHKMLWTTPESLHEQQPLHSQKYSVVLTSDARIDNREDLIRQLHIKKTVEYTDADLIIIAYKKWGFESPKYLVGDFAFAIWDEKEQLLFCARDRIGIKPFQYYMNYNSFLFSSEISSIFKATSLEKKIDNIAIEDYLLSLSIDFEATFYQHIKRLPPASIMIIQNGKKRIMRYWTPNDLPDFNTRTAKQNSEEFLDLLRQATQSQLRSAYATGVSLSGGLDSSAITYFAANTPVKVPFSAYSMRFGKLACDESSYIDEVVRYTNSTSFSIDAHKIDYAKKYSIDNYYTTAPDWPAFGFYLPMNPFMKMVKKHGVRVLLTGHGGDHMTQGSEYYLTDWIKEGKIISTIEMLMQYKNPLQIFKKTLISPFIPDILLKARRTLINKNKVPLLKSGRTEVSFSDINDIYPINNAARKFDIEAIMGATTSLLNDTGGTHAGANNIEERYPFFDHKVVEFSFQIPAWQKCTPIYQKHFFANYSHKILPASVRTRNNKASYEDMLKMQFNQNISNYNFSHSCLEERNLISSKKYFDKMSECNICNQWKYLTLEKWMEKQIENRI